MKPIAVLLAGFLLGAAATASGDTPVRKFAVCFGESSGKTFLTPVIVDRPARPTSLQGEFYAYVQATYGITLNSVDCQHFPTAVEAQAYRDQAAPQDPQYTPYYVETGWKGNVD
jgi:hypothetical protein